jgi:hypothetical protein
MCEPDGKLKHRSNSMQIPFAWGTPEYNDMNCRINAFARAQIMANKLLIDYAVYKLGPEQYVIDRVDWRIPNEGILKPIVNCQHEEVSRTSCLSIECDICKEFVSQDVNDNLKWKLSRELYPQ